MDQFSENLPYKEYYPYLIAIVSPITIVAAYNLFSNPKIPGLYLAMAREISNNGYLLPETIPHFTEGGIPFAYPPLGFYFIALVHDITGMEYLSATIFLSFVWNGVLGLLIYKIAQELFDDKIESIVATVLATTAPAIFWYMAIPGGAVRGLGYCFFLATVFFGLCLYSDFDRRWLIGATVSFGLAVLSHPLCGYAAGLWFLTIYLTKDRSISGLVHGTIVAVGGVSIASVWWGTVLLHTGIDPFLAGLTSGSRVSLSLDSVIKFIRFAIKVPTLEQTQYASTVAFYSGSLGGLYLLARRKMFLPVVFVVSWFTTGAERFVYLAEILMAVSFLYEGVLPMLQSKATSQEWGQIVKRGALVAIILLSVLSGVMYASNQYTRVYDGDTTLMTSGWNADDQQAANWIHENTPEQSTFIAIGAASEKLPFYAERTVLNVPWGAEFDPNQDFQALRLFSHDLSKSSNFDDIVKKSIQHGFDADYYYIPKIMVNQSTVNKMDGYEVVFRNNGIFLIKSIE
ncbi:ArnT family glycosyltransferase [Halorhabdus rudnickae]|uniref:ArnT family glycosyltransferase n=1 Tax=Halorhabdus rudnickae TaxID=1775544 RepID=UPI001082F903|nr:glycosyltransferase family 39 protein [Halorhabdus rudnickae]